ncbi:MAG: glycosyltransferase family 4 protein [Candidatus Promineifilaceae bacterium]
MHVLIATPAFPPYIGGGERHTGTLAKNLIGRGHTVSVVTSAAEEESDFWNGRGRDVVVESDGSALTIIRVPIQPMPGGFRGLLAWRKSMVVLSTVPGTGGLLAKMAGRVPAMANLDEAFGKIEKPVDVVHAFNISWEHMMMAGWQYARRNSIPFVASPLAHLGTGSRDRVALNSTMRHQRGMLSRADLLLTNTLVEAQGLQSRGVKTEKVDVAGPGIDIPEYVADLPESAVSKKPFVLYVGRMSYDKGVLHAVQSVLRLREQGSKLHIILIGQETEEFSRFFDDLPDRDKRYVHVLGVIEESLKHAYLSEAEALLLPSRTDSFGIVLLESWLYSKPVVAAAAGGIPAVVDNGKTGILVPFGDISSLANAIRLVTEDQELNQILGENGFKKLMSQYTWEAVTDKVLGAYHEVVDAGAFSLEQP